MKTAINNLLFKSADTLSKPTAGRTMLGLIKNYGADLHLAHTLLINELKNFPSGINQSNWSDDFLLFRYFENTKVIVTNDRDSLISSSLILNWICGRILNHISIQADLVDAEIWFQKCSKDDCISKNITPTTHEAILKLLRRIEIHLMLEAIPYLAEVFETGNETADEKGANRVKKKNNGIYYTPTDIIDFIVTRSIANRNEEKHSLELLRWYDPALGTGSFLLSVLKHYSSTNIYADTETLIN